MKLTNKLIAGTAARVLQSLGYNPREIGAAIDSSTRSAVLVGVSVAERAVDLLPPGPPLELAVLFQTAELRENVPAALLEALSWECAQYGASVALPDAAGPMALPKQYAAASAEDQVCGAARAIRLTAERSSMADALVHYCGSRDLARRVVGTAGMIAAARAQVPSGTADMVRQFMGWA